MILSIFIWIVDFSRMPLPFLPDTPDEALFPLLNGVLLGYACLVLLPTWRHTPSVTLWIATGYAVVYAALLAQRIFGSATEFPEAAGFDSLDAVEALFSDRAALFAGWTHYISFDLFVARHVLLDSQSRGIPHLGVVWIIPLVLLIGPAGFAFYMILIVPLFAARAPEKLKSR